MARARKETPFRSGLVPALVRLVRAHGGDADLLVRRFGLPAGVEEHADAPITAVEFGRLLEAASGELDDPFLALRLPAELELRGYGLGELAVRASPTVHEALRRMVRYAPLENDRLVLALEERGDAVAFTCHVAGHPRGLTRHAHEYVLASVLTHVRTLTGLPVVPRAVWFIHARPKLVDAPHRFFGTEELDFGRADNGLLFDAGWMAARLTTADPRLLVTAEQLADSALRTRAPAEDFTTRVAARIEEALGSGAGAEDIAARLHMSKRTLQRRLEEGGLSFQELVDRVRAEKARALVRDGHLTLNDVAFRLGFSDVSSFSRSFRRWTGVSPGRYRLLKPPLEPRYI
ncbi:AraC family transcriptional regulator [Archangium sp.]|uniref:AraC family transcriptional regulator n=1 Tax=Archangium sp. TaxID=1872627 RepID=UPI002D4F4119|nr:AraC family transcriptional regulator ligand-binding domain-containing protein [Archangium sp.]HYO57676.1 AraC family transcriptional regulator ligand-binding domain-containing protein [Archangium sp.]